MDSTAILFNKEGLLFSRVAQNQYRLTFNIQNNNIILAQIIDFNLIKLIFDLNPDIYERVNVTPVSETDVVATLLMKHLFEDLGLSQRFSHIRVTKAVGERSIIFNAQSIKGVRPEGMPVDAEPVAIQELTCTCNMVTQRAIAFEVDVVFDRTTTIPQFVEKIVGTILFKIFSRVKQFIENVKL
jgi:hypothetical protein